MMKSTPPTVYEEYVVFLGKSKWYAHADREDTGELAYHVLGLAGEGGEFVDLVKKIIRDFGYNHSVHNLSPELRLRLIDEAGDVMWYFTQLLTLLGVTHDELMQANMNKLEAREHKGERQHVR